MGLITDLKALLARPVTAPPAPVGKARHDTLAKPVTEDELQAALARMAAERSSAYAVISEAADKRERLLMDENSDEELAALARAVDGASLLLERLDRLEPEARNKLIQLQDERRRLRWAEVRDSYIAAGRRHAEALRRSLFDASEGQNLRAAVLNEFPGSADILPRLPVMPASAPDELDAELDRLSTIAYNPRPEPTLPFSLGARMKRPGFDAASEAGRWGDASVMGAIKTVSVRMLTPREGPDGRWIKVGDTVEMTGAEAEREIAAGRATPVHEEAA